jgi:hypothetical protein
MLYINFDDPLIRIVVLLNRYYLIDVGAYTTIPRMLSDTE